MEIVTMQTTHIMDIMELERLSFAIPWSEQAFSEELDNPHAVYFCAVLRGKTIGYAGMWVVLDEGQITNIAVHPESRRVKAGSRLLERLIEYAKDTGIKLLTLEVRKSNIPAISLYAGFGFATAGIRKRYYADNREDAVVMNLNL